MPSTTVKVPVELRDRLAHVAAQRHQTIAAVIATALDSAEERQFWRDVAATMAPGGAARDVSILDGSLADGIDPDETWDDVW
ncbi:MAG: hypothetical protein LBK72_07115 [Bifidobacteriaceae bacterium]|jgi:predicted transcriptional regulator|nr:hypothetical protein [Bifidobacteriaceae bacterium]